MQTQSPFSQRSSTVFIAPAVRLFCAVLLLGSLTIGADISFAQSGGATHTVGAGESLSSIAAAYNVSVSALIRANGIRNPNLLRVGQVLVIPAAAAPASVETPISAPLPQTAPLSPAGATLVPTPTAQYVPPIQVAPLASDSVYTVRPGESLSAIARRYGTSVDAIVARNGLPSYTIFAGQRLLIPAGTPAVNPFVTPKSPQPAPASPRSLATPTPNGIQTNPELLLLPTAAATPNPSR